METVTNTIKLYAFCCFRLTFFGGKFSSLEVGPPIECCDVKIIGAISPGHVTQDFLFGNYI